MSGINFDEMRRLSADIRLETIRALKKVGSGHVGGCASVADVLAVLYGGVMKIRPEQPDWEDRDWLVLSKGHAGPALYAALALKGFFPMDWLDTINLPKTRLPSHCDMHKTPGVDMTTGSLGQGFSAAVGIALANRIKGRECYTFCIVGDGELNEGEIWEGAEFAGHKKLDHLIVFVDWNKKQLDGYITDVSDFLPIDEKFKAFGFDVDTVKGDDCDCIYNAVMRAKAASGKPKLIILDTSKGSGYPFAERAFMNHYLPICEADCEEAVLAIEECYSKDSYPGGIV